MDVFAADFYPHDIFSLPFPGTAGSLAAPVSTRLCYARDDFRRTIFPPITFRKLSVCVCVCMCVCVCVCVCV